MWRRIRLILQMHSLDPKPSLPGERDPLGKAIPGPQVFQLAQRSNSLPLATPCS